METWIEQNNPQINPNFISHNKKEIAKALETLNGTKHLEIAENIISEMIEGREEKPYQRGTIVLRGDIFYIDVFLYVKNSVAHNTENQKVIQRCADLYIIARLRLEGFDVHS